MTIPRSDTSSLQLARTTFVLSGYEACWQEVLGRIIAYFPLIRQGPRRKWRVRQFSIVTYAFIAAITYFPSRYLATRGAIHIHTHRVMGAIYVVRRWDGLRCYKCAVSVINMCSAIPKLIGRIHSMVIDRCTFIIFFQNNENRLKIY
jgi:hypothetical protein